MPKKYKLVEGMVTYLREKEDLRREKGNEYAEISEAI